MPYSLCISSDSRDRSSASGAAICMRYASSNELIRAARSACVGRFVACA